MPSYEDVVREFYTPSEIIAQRIVNAGARQLRRAFAVTLPRFVSGMIGVAEAFDIESLLPPTNPAPREHVSPDVWVRFGIAVASRMTQDDGRTFASALQCHSLGVIGRPMRAWNAWQLLREACSPAVLERIVITARNVELRVLTMASGGTWGITTLCSNPWLRYLRFADQVYAFDALSVTATLRLAEYVSTG